MGAKVDIAKVISTFAPTATADIPWNVDLRDGRKGGYASAPISNVDLPCDHLKSGYSMEYALGCIKRRSRNASRTNDQGGLLTSSGGLLERRGWTLETD